MLPESFYRFLESELSGEEKPFLLAVSGGIDSMVMYDLFWRAGVPVGVAHCNFSLRGEEADAETEMVRRIAEERGTPFHFRRFDTRRTMAETGLSMQETARRLRYDWFAACAAENGYGRVAVAHNLNDSVETFFINTVRGTGVRGLAGIRRRQGAVVRPLLEATRAEIEDYAASFGVEYRNDSSNASDKYLRNKFRHRILPEIIRFAPGYLDRMRENMDRVGQAAGFLDRRVAEIRGRVVHAGRIRLGEIDPEDLPFVLYELLREDGFSASVVGDMVRAFRAGETGKRFSGRRAEAALERGGLLLRRNHPEGKYRFFLPASGEDFSLRLAVGRVPRREIGALKTDGRTLLLDCDRTVFPLRVRRWHEGDFFVPFGMKGRKKVGDYLTDVKADAFQRSRQTVLEAKEILWITGRRAGEAARISEEATTILRITLQI